MGGNDADQGMDLNNFTDSYTSLINDLTSENRHIIVSGLLPRASVNLDPYNERLRTLCEDQNIDFVDSYNSFQLASGDLADSYFHRDGVHPNSFRIKKMLKKTLMSITGSQLLVLALSLLVQSGGETHIKPNHIILLKVQTFTIDQNTVIFVVGRVTIQ